MPRVALQAPNARVSAVVAEIGLAPGGDLKAAFADHVKKAAAIELAKSGHPPVPNIDSAKVGSSATDSDLHAHWKAMPHDAKRLEFFSKHEAAIRRASGLQY